MGARTMKSTDSDYLAQLTVCQLSRYQIAISQIVITFNLVGVAIPLSFLLAGITWIGAIVPGAVVIVILARVTAGLSQLSIQVKQELLRRNRK